MSLSRIGSEALAIMILLSLSEKFERKNKNESSTLSEMVNDISDEQLVADCLEPDSLTTWFRKNNTDNSLKNVLIYPYKANLKDKKILKLLNAKETNSKNLIIQVLLNNKNDIVLCRSVEFEEIVPNLDKLFDENNGIITVE